MEAVALLGASDAEATLLAALKTGSSWIQETAFGACRYLGQLPSSVERALTNNLLSRSQVFILNPDRDLYYLLSVSDVFRPVMRRFRAARIDTATSLIAAITLIAAILEYPGNNWVSQVVVGALMGVPIQSLVLVVAAGRVIRLDLDRGAWISPILTPSELVLGALRAVPLGLLAVFLVLGVIDTYRFLTDEANLALWQQINTVHLLLGLAALPFYGGVLALSELRVNLRGWRIHASFRVLSDDLRLWLLFGGWLVGMIGIAIGLTYLAELVPKEYVAFVVYPLTALTLMYSVGLPGLLSLRAWLRDRPRLAAATVKLVPRRTEIGAAFMGFETAKARERYVEWVEREAVLPEHLEALADIVANPWPGGRRPNRHNDRASTHLARLDERWLKLDV